jgi:hypothetical protein
MAERLKPLEKEPGLTGDSIHAKKAYRLQFIFPGTVHHYA